MNTTEGLAKGNLLEFSEDGSICEVKGIDADELGITVYFPETEVETWIELWQFSPIQLTKDWFIKIGFTVRENDELLIHLPPEIEEKCNGDIGFKRSDFFFNSRLNRFMDCQSRICVDYVHEVQNLVYWHTRHLMTLAATS